MSKLRSVSTAFWSDPFIEGLTPQEKLLFLYLITNEKTNMIGIYETSIKKMAFETGLDIETISNALKSFESLNKLKYINNHIILLKFIKHQNFNANMKISAIRIFNNLPNYLKMKELILDETKPSESFEILSNHYQMVRKVEYELEYELEIESEQESKNCSLEGGDENLKLDEDKKSKHFIDKEYLNSENNTNGLENSNLYRKPIVPNYDDVLMHFKSAGGTDEMAKKFFDTHDSTGWFFKSSPIINFKSLANGYIQAWKKNEKKGAKNDINTQNKKSDYTDELVESYKKPQSFR